MPRSAKSLTITLDFVEQARKANRDHALALRMHLLRKNEKTKEALRRATEQRDNLGRWLILQFGCDEEAR